MHLKGDIEGRFRIIRAEENTLFFLGACEKYPCSRVNLDATNIPSTRKLKAIDRQFT